MFSRTDATPFPPSRRIVDLCLGIDRKGGCTFGNRENGIFLNARPRLPVCRSYEARRMPVDTRYPTKPRRFRLERLVAAITICDREVEDSLLFVGCGQRCGNDQRLSRGGVGDIRLRDDGPVRLDS